MTASATYHLQRDSQRLLLTRDEVGWQNHLTGSEPQADIVLNFGCGLQLTPHLMVELIDILAALGVTVSAVAGPQWCCGMPVDEEGAGLGTAVVRASVRHLAAFRPRTALQSCGAWWPQTGKLRDAGETVPFDLEPLPLFIMTALQRRAEALDWPDAPMRRVLIHRNSHVPTEMRAERATSLSALDVAVPAILGIIPSVEIVGDADPPSLGSPCDVDDDDRPVLDGVSPEGCARVLAELAEQGSRADASMIVCAHHRCAQEWGKFSSAGMEVRHYISVLADAMGLARPNRYHTCWSLPTIDAILDATEPAWRSWSMSRDEADSLAVRIFPMHPRSPA